MTNLTTEEALRRFSVKQIAELLGDRSEQFVRDLITKGKLDAKRDGRLYFITADALQAYLDSQEPARADS